ncbi:MAG: histidine ammonia-lyase [Acidobacteriota bacterium]|jgi:histidine ammonia-lyase|nr:histidine ammonia-lyase [Acidobacteriota bacterium]
MIELNGQQLSLERIERVASGEEQIVLSMEARARVEAARRVVERIVETGAVVYGVNTGFGKLSDYVVPRDELRHLQLNLVRSHSCGVGQPLSLEETRAMMLLRANVLALGYSGARVEIVETLLKMIERDVVPVVPEKGSVGASGDLAPLAHLALVVVGEGEAFFAGERMAGAEAMRRARVAPVTLEAKEGLALLNGTQAMTAVGALALARAGRITRAADVSGAMTLEAVKGTPTAFDERIHAARPHAGQQESAAHLRELLAGSEIRESHRENDPRVQDAYSLRCMPQVHGAARDALSHTRALVETETASATDNPLVFAETSEVLSGGNFHGAPLAIGFDYAGIAMTHLGNIIERRIDRVVNPEKNEGLPPFLTAKPGVESGLMVTQIAAVALLNECKVLSHPASTDNLPTDGGKEDHVSMGMTAALKLRSIVMNIEYVLAIELIAAAEGLEHRLPLKPGRGARRGYDAVRSHVPRLTHDRPFSADIEKIAQAIRRGEFDF